MNKGDDSTTWGVRRNVFILGLVSFFTDFSTELIYPFLPLFLSSVLGLGTAFIGLIEGIAQSTAGLLKLFSGWLSDRLKRRKFLILGGYGLSALAKPALSLATAGWHVLLIRFLERAGKGFRTAPRDAVIADVTPSGERGRAFGFHRSMDTLGAVAGPLAAFFLIPLLNDDFRSLFLLSFFPALVAIFLIAFFLSERRVICASDAAPRFRFGALSRRFKVYVAAISLFSLGNSSDAFLILRANGLGVRMELIPILWMTFNVVYALSAIPGGMLSDRFGRRGTIILGMSIYAAVYGGFAFARDSVHVWMLFVIYGVYHGLANGVLRAHVADLVPSNLRATAFGIFHAAEGLMALPASMLMGALWQTVGVAVAFCLGAILALVAAIVLVVGAR